jgi:hypothetical protein
MDWLVGLCALTLRLSQAKTLSEITEAACRTERMGLSALARRLASETAVKHRIKRVWRFADNDRVEPSAVMAEVVRKLTAKRRKRLLVALDWTDLSGFHTLMAAAVIKGRSVPLLWGSHAAADLTKSRNALEEGLLLLLRSMVPKALPVIILADRGFGRTELARFCRTQGFGYVIRIKPDVWVKAKGFAGKLTDYPVKKGMCRMLRDVAFRKKDPATTHVIVRWKRGLPKKRDECWFLMTDQDGRADRLSELYGGRTRIEEFFRDGKSRRTGWGLRNVRLEKAARLDRLLLVLALAYILLTGLGLTARRKLSPSAWCSTNSGKRDQCSAFFIGFVLWEQHRADPADLFAAVVESSKSSEPNWG